jgi:hypothetical protein
MISFNSGAQPQNRAINPLVGQQPRAGSLARTEPDGLLAPSIFVE